MDEDRVLRDEKRDLDTGDAQHAPEMPPQPEPTRHECTRSSLVDLRIFEDLI